MQLYCVVNFDWSVVMQMHHAASFFSPYHVLPDCDEINLRIDWIAREKMAWQGRKIDWWKNNLVARKRQVIWPVRLVATYHFTAWHRVFKLRVRAVVLNLFCWRHYAWNVFCSFLLNVGEFKKVSWKKLYSIYCIQIPFKCKYTYFSIYCF